MQPPLALILGGRDKLTPLGDMIELIRQRVQHVVIYGEARERFGRELREAGYSSISEAAALPAALRLAAESLPDGGNIVLSPACSSFDLYNSFEERGNHFKQLVNELDSISSQA